MRKERLEYLIFTGHIDGRRNRTKLRVTNLVILFECSEKQITQKRVTENKCFKTAESHDPSRSQQIKKRMSDGYNCRSNNSLFNTVALSFLF